MLDNESRLNTLGNTDTETIFRFPFSSLLTLSLLYKTPVVMRFLVKITLSCIWVAIPVDLVIFTSICLWCGRTVARAVVVRSRDYQIFSVCRLLHFLTHGARLARFARESSAIIEVLAGCVVFRGSSW